MLHNWGGILDDICLDCKRWLMVWTDRSMSLAELLRRSVRECADLQILPNPGDGCTIERSNEDIELCIGQRLYELLDL